MWGCCTWVQVCSGTIPGYRCVWVLYLGTGVLGYCTWVQVCGGAVPGQRPVLQLWLWVGCLLQWGPGVGARGCLWRCLKPPLQGWVQAPHAPHALHTHTSEGWGEEGDCVSDGAVVFVISCVWLSRWNHHRYHKEPGSWLFVMNPANHL